MKSLNEQLKHNSKFIAVSKEFKNFPKHVLSAPYMINPLNPAKYDCTAENNPEYYHDTDTSNTHAHLSQPSSKLSQLFINMKLCLSHVEQCDFLLRHPGIVWPLSRATATSSANFSVDTYCSGIHFPPDSLESPDLS